MADLTLADILMERNALNPVMREAYDRPAPLGAAQRHVEAFGAGFVDPMGVPSWLANKLIGSPNTDWYERWAQEKRNRSPFAAGVGSTVLPALLGLGGLRAAGQLTSAEALGASPELAALGISVSGVRSAFVDPAREQRPQAAYPREDAY
jgi:hypothetical protein